MPISELLDGESQTIATPFHELDGPSCPGSEDFPKLPPFGLQTMIISEWNVRRGVLMWRRPDP